MNDHPASLVPAFDSKVIMMTMMMTMMMMALMMMALMIMALITIDIAMMMMKECEKRVCAKLQAAQ